MQLHLSSFGLLLMRMAIGVMMFVGHALGKIEKFSDLKETFPDPLGMGNQMSLIGALAGEALCAGLIVIGLGTRFAAAGMVFTMAVAAFVVHADHAWFASQADGGPSKEMALLYLVPAAMLIFTGPGAISLDYIFFGRKPKDANLADQPKS